MTARKPYPSDVGDEEWDFVAPYLILFPLDASQRQYALREVFNALRWLVRSGAPWRLLPHDFPPWHTVYQQTQRWFRAGCFETIAQDLRAVLRLASGKEPSPSAAMRIPWKLDTQTAANRSRSPAQTGHAFHGKLDTPGVTTRGRSWGFTPDQVRLSIGHAFYAANPHSN